MSGDLRFDGRVVVVTGAGGRRPSLGRSYAALLAARGAKVVVNDLGVGPDGRGIVAASAKQVAEEIRAAGGEAVADTNTVATEAGAAAVVQTALDTWGRVDAVINNAGVVLLAEFDEIAAADIERIVDVHLYGTIWMCRAAWPHMVTQGYGRIVNVTARAILGERKTPVYEAAKAGVLSFARTLAAAGHEHGIRANALLPHAATVATTHLNDDSEWLAKALTESPPELVAPAAALLAHELCPVSGKCIASHGGHTYELFFSRTEGLHDRALTLESLHERFAEVIDRDAATAIGDPVEEDAARLHFRPRGYSADEQRPSG